MRTKLFLALVFVLFAANTFAQCAMCKKIAGDATEENDMSVGEQLNTGIIYLMVIPYIILFIIFRKRIFSFFKELRTAGRN